MYGLFFLLFYVKEIRLISYKKILLLFFCFFILFFTLFIEDTSSNGQNILELRSGSTSESNYDFKAPLNIVYKINMYELVSSPIKYNHSDSFIAITLLDTFGDYYDIFWDNDSSLYFKHRKPLFEVKESKTLTGPEFNNESNLWVFYLQNKTDLYERKIFRSIIFDNFLLFFV